MNGELNNGRAGGKMKMLVVDDEPSVCDCISMILSLEGHEVVTANSGREALALFVKGNYDLVFTDYSMPGMTGVQLATQIKSIAPDQPIMMITGLAPVDTPKAVDMILNKPFQLDELRQAVDRLPAGKISRSKELSGT